MDSDIKTYISKVKLMLRNVKKMESPVLMDLKYYVHNMEKLLMITEKDADCYSRTAMLWIEEINNFTKKLSNDTLQYLHDNEFPKITTYLCAFVSIENQIPIYYETIFNTWIGFLQSLPLQAIRKGLSENETNIRALIKCLDFCDDFMQQKQIMDIFLIYVNASKQSKYLCEFILQHKKGQKSWKLLIGQCLGKPPTHLTIRNVINALNQENYSSTLYSIKVAQIYFNEQQKIKEEDQYFWMDLSVKQGKVSLTNNEKMSDQNVDIFTQFSVRIQNVSSIKIEELGNEIQFTIKLKADMIAGNNKEDNIKQIDVIFTKDALENFANKKIRLDQQMKKGDKTFNNEILEILDCLVKMTKSSIQERIFIFDNVEYPKDNNNIGSLTNIKHELKLSNNDSNNSSGKATQIFILPEKNQSNSIEDYQHSTPSNLQCRSSSENNNDDVFDSLKNQEIMPHTEDDDSWDKEYFSDTEELNNVSSLYIETGGLSGLQKKIKQMTPDQQNTQGVRKLKHNFQKIKSMIARSTLFPPPQSMSGQNIDPYDMQAEQSDKKQPKKPQKYPKNKKETVLKKTKVVVNQRTNSKRPTKITTRAKKTVKYAYSSSDDDTEYNNSNENRQIGNKYKSLTASRPQSVGKKRIRLTRSNVIFTPLTPNWRNKDKNVNQRNAFIKTVENSSAYRRSISKNILENKLNEEDQSMAKRSTEKNIRNFENKDQSLQSKRDIDRPEKSYRTAVLARNLKNISNANIIPSNVTDCISLTDQNQLKTNNILPQNSNVSTNQPNAIKENNDKTNKALSNLTAQRSNVNESVQSATSIIEIDPINTYITPTQNQFCAFAAKKNVNFDLPDMNKSKSFEVHVDIHRSNDPRGDGSNIPSLPSFNITDQNLLTTSPFKPINELQIMPTEFEKNDQQNHLIELIENPSIQLIPTPSPAELPKSHSIQLRKSPSTQLRKSPSLQPQKTSTPIVEHIFSQSSMPWAAEDHFADGYSTDTDSRKSNNVDIKDILEICHSGLQQLTQEQLKNYDELNFGETFARIDENNLQFEKNPLKTAINPFHQLADGYNSLRKEQLKYYKNNENSWKLINEQVTELKQKSKRFATFSSDVMKLKMLSAKRFEQRDLNIRAKMQKLPNHANAYKEKLLKQNLKKIGKDLCQEITTPLP